MPKKTNKKTHTVVVTEQDLLDNPEFAAQGIKVGDAVEVANGPVPTPEPQPSNNPPQSEEAEEKTDEEEIVVSYQDRAFGPSTRVFTKAIHGKKARAIAKQFAESNGGTIL